MNLTVGNSLDSEIFVPGDCDVVISGEHVQTPPREIFHGDEKEGGKAQMTVALKETAHSTKIVDHWRIIT